NQRVADFFPETLLLTPQRACWGATRAVLPAFSHVRSA
ncbi:ABC transporter ATP-binding protein, partial [Klebsiella pneumoniae]